MTRLEVVKSFVSQQECDKAAFQNGFRRSHGESEGWYHYTSTTAQGAIWLALEAAGGWLIAMDHAGVITEIDLDASDVEGPGLARFCFDTLAELYEVMPRIYSLAVSLPDAPLQEYQRRTRGLPKTTEAERLVVQRIGQDIFRERLIDYWQGRCPLTGITDLSLLKASHIKPWRDCDSDEERLDVHNGLLLSALWDAAFDDRLLTFDKDGQVKLSALISTEAKTCLGTADIRLPLTDRHQEYMKHHRKLFSG
ncbi:hypothetical protein PsAD13_04167 [Pseudovibrio sp. Ad13]|uniref:HNH endonuclease n=1 Tax=Pseudovibrio sp. Ad13 TaxID=989396 RepID=UPI0007AE4F2C|nr:HNH endonuclease [Pseudovibrio sp. Ad13]KZK81218.1 hypothetical protein PsAD13_04167 [Pseudovibrio sp. Ad13]